MNISTALDVINTALDLNFRAGILSRTIGRMAEDMVRHCGGDTDAEIRAWADAAKAEIESFGDFAEYDACLWIVCAVRWALD